MRSYLRPLVLSALILGALGLGGCVAGNGAAGLLLIFAGAAAALAGCGGTKLEDREVDCCEDGQVKRCLCDAGFTCNYAPYDVKPDGTCTFKNLQPPPGPDANVLAFPDAGADMSLEPAPDLAPNATPDATPDLARDAGEDRPAMSYRCCPSGRIETCYCPPATACNYGQVIDCGDGTCVETFFPSLDAGALCKARDGGGQ